MTKHVTTLGAFSLSLAVKDLPASQAFYEKLGFKQVMGDPTQNWLILRNGTRLLFLQRAVDVLIDEERVSVNSLDELAIYLL
jgi:predicted lactoylglutathione lyase